MTIRWVLALIALTVATGVSPLQAQRNNDNKAPKRSKAEQLDVDTVVRMVDGVAAGSQAAPADVSITWDRNDFMKGQDGGTYLPFNLGIERSKLGKGDVAFYVRLVDKAAVAAPAGKDNKDNKNQAARPTYAWEEISFMEIPASGKLSRAVQVRPGQYDVFIAIKEKGTDQKNAPPSKLGLLRRELTVPDFNAPELVTSTMLVASGLEQLTATLSPKEQQENPYTFGPMKISLSPDSKFAKSGEFSLVYWIYGTGTASTGKPDVLVEYAFHQKLAEGEKYFNRTQPKALNATSLPPEFNLAAGHQLTEVLQIPLASFPAGDYRLEVKITDKTSSKTVVQNVAFTVLPA